MGKRRIVIIFTGAWGMDFVSSSPPFLEKRGKEETKSMPLSPVIIFAKLYRVSQFFIYFCIQRLLLNNIFINNT
jgi:quinol-cytochrome oxidoreductase complex cytochrome b subunit